MVRSGGPFAFYQFTYHNSTHMPLKRILLLGIFLIFLFVYMREDQSLV